MFLIPRKFRISLNMAITSFHTQADYVVRIFGPAIVIFPRGLVNFLSRFDKLEKAYRENTWTQVEAYTGSLLEDSRAGGGSG